MRGAVCAFNGLVREDLVRDGEVVSVSGHANGIHGEMFLQICKDYASLPDPRSLSIGEIRFFYAGLVPDLKYRSKKGS